MKHELAVLALTFAGAAFAAEPNTPATPKPAQPSVDARAPGKPLDLRPGNIRNYMMPKEYLAAINQPDPEKNTVVVEGNRVLVPMKFEKPVPAGFPPATLWWALRNPAQSWRILVPDLKAPPPGPPEVVPPPVFRPGP